MNRSPWDIADKSDQLQSTMNTTAVVPAVRESNLHGKEQAAAAALEDARAENGIPTSDQDQQPHSEKPDLSTPGYSPSQTDDRPGGGDQNKKDDRKSSDDNKPAETPKGDGGVTAADAAPTESAPSTEHLAQNSNHKSDETGKDLTPTNGESNFHGKEQAAAAAPEDARAENGIPTSDQDQQPHSEKPDLSTPGYSPSQTDDRPGGGDQNKKDDRTSKRGQQPGGGAARAVLSHQQPDLAIAKREQQERHKDTDVRPTGYETDRGAQHGIHGQQPGRERGTGGRGRGPGAKRRSGEGQGRATGIGDSSFGDHGGVTASNTINSPGTRKFTADSKQPVTIPSKDKSRKRELRGSLDVHEEHRDRERQTVNKKRKNGTQSATGQSQAQARHDQVGRQRHNQTLQETRASNTSIKVLTPSCSQDQQESDDKVVSEQEAPSITSPRKFVEYNKEKLIAVVLVLLVAFSLKAFNEFAKDSHSQIMALKQQESECTNQLQSAKVDANTLRTTSEETTKNGQADLAHYKHLVHKYKTQLDDLAERHSRAGDDVNAASKSTCPSEIALELKLLEGQHTLKQNAIELANCYYLYAVVTRQHENTISAYQKGPYGEEAYGRWKQRPLTQVLADAVFHKPAEWIAEDSQRYQVTPEQRRKLQRCDSLATNVMLS